MRDRALLRSTPRDFFRELLLQSCESQKVSPSADAEFYLVQLLEGFVRFEHGLFDRPLALEYLASFEDSPYLRHRRLRQVGDTALFVSGVFTESLESRSVGAEYYAALGGLAYGQLARGALPVGGEALAPVFTELSLRFLDFVRVLAHMSLDDLFGSDRDTLRIYRRWLATRGARDAGELARRGVIPFAPKHPRVH